MSSWQIGQSPTTGGTFNLRPGNHRAYQAIREARQGFIRDFFQGTQLVWRRTSLVETCASIRWRTKELSASTAQTAGKVVIEATSPARQLIEQLICNIFDLPCLDAVIELLGELGLNVIHEVVGAMVPLVATAGYAGRSLGSWGLTSLEIWKRIKVARHRSFLLPGDPSAAAAALAEVIERDIARNALTAARMSGRTAVAAGCDTIALLGLAGTGASFGGSAVLTGVAQAAGPLAGAMNLAAALVHQLFLLARDLKEKRKANKLLKDAETIDAGIFQVCPILGCYLLVNSDASAIIDFDPADMAKPHWLDDVDRKYRGHIKPLLRLARSAILNHRFVLAGADGHLRADKGVVGLKAWHRFIPGK